MFINFSFFFIHILTLLNQISVALEFIAYILVILCCIKYLKK